MLKVLVFRYFFWFVLSVVFITGASRISVFGLGYLLGCFFFLLFGTKLMVKRSRTRLILWDCLIIYNVAVIISKSVLSVSVRNFPGPPPPPPSSPWFFSDVCVFQILACVFVFKMQERFCWVIQLFSLVCTVKGYYDREYCRSSNLITCGSCRCSCGHGAPFPLCLLFKMNNLNQSEPSADVSAGLIFLWFFCNSKRRAQWHVHSSNRRSRDPLGRLLFYLPPAAEEGLPQFLLSACERGAPGLSQAGIQVHFKWKISHAVQ